MGGRDREREDRKKGSVSERLERERDRVRKK